MLPESTTAARLVAPHKVVIEEVAVPEPRRGEVLLRVMAVGLCGSDTHWYEEGGIGDSRLDTGLILGHEFSGVIESGPRRGERVAVDPAVPCLDCQQCREGRPNTCPNVGFAGHGTTDGALRGHMVWPERCLTSLPPEMSIETGALLEPLGVALHAVDLAGLDEPASIGVVGCGPIGLMIVVALKASGNHHIVACDPLAHRLRAAGDMGVDAVSVPSDGTEFDVVFETAGTDEAMALALDRMRPGGRVVVVGIPREDRTTLRASAARRKELTLSWCRRMRPEDLPRAAVLGSGVTECLEGLVSHRFGLTGAANAFAALADRRGLKILVAP